MFEVVYRKPEDPKRERRISDCVSQFSGVVTFREDDWGQLRDAICLTIEFPDLESAKAAAEAVDAAGQRIEGPLQDYGDH